MAVAARMSLIEGEVGAGSLETIVFFIQGRCSSLHSKDNPKQGSKVMTGVEENGDKLLMRG